MTADERVDLLRRCRASGLDDDDAQEFVRAEVARRAAVPSTSLPAAIARAFRQSAGCAA